MARVFGKDLTETEREWVIDQLTYSLNFLQDYHRLYEVITKFNLQGQYIGEWGRAAFYHDSLIDNFIAVLSESNDLDENNKSNLLTTIREFEGEIWDFVDTLINWYRDKPQFKMGVEALTPIDKDTPRAGYRPKWTVDKAKSTIMQKLTGQENEDQL